MSLNILNPIAKIAALMAPVPMVIGADTGPLFTGIVASVLLRPVHTVFRIETGLLCIALLPCRCRRTKSWSGLV